ncbi:hypothetical protein MIND_00057500 [Mycena indigotica]|uniref:Brain protein I3 n=1 Tax=Mycena indigotica TaxID=2126181 RepID=A0A8H6TER7_9AGAR|nr:uncharacterized protein MIND_00057500 [Mycena indigotica]KAF7315427.1 hypothetical protein MIND_00057500 [Mycena indigotica]
MGLRLHPWWSSRKKNQDRVTHSHSCHRQSSNQAQSAAVHKSRAIHSCSLTFMSNEHNDSPPAYDGLRPESPKDVKPLQAVPQMTPGPSLPYAPHAGPSYTPNNPVVFHYRNPRTGEHVASLLPPNHPEMECLQRGEHVPHSSFSLLGYILALAWFPLGVGLCLLDRRVKCSHCGKVLEDGLCN